MRYITIYTYFCSMKYSIRLIFMLCLISTQLWAQTTSYQQVKPKKSEGIHALLKRYGMDSKQYYNAFLELNKTVLNGGTELSLHQSYKLPKKTASAAPSSSKKNYEPLFGKALANYKIKDYKLRNAVYYIVAGHGGPDPGAQGKRAGHTLSEDEYAYDIALRLSRNLMEHGAKVYIIVRDPNDGIREQEYLKSDKDERVWPNKKIPLNAVSKLRQRSNAINHLYKKHKGKYQRLIVLHIDSRSKSKRIDIYGYYFSKSKYGKRFTNNLIQSLERNYRKAQPGRGFSGISKTRDGLYMVRKPYPPTCFLELGNIQNSKDQVRFISPNNRQAVANWLLQGCIKDFKTK